MRQPRQASWLTSTMPSSSRLYIAPDGHDATHEGLRQCSQIRGRYIMKTRSYSMRTASSTPRRFGSAGACSGAPARSSSQLGPHSIDMGSPVTAEMGRATGWCSDTGARVSVVVVVGQRLVVVVERGRSGLKKMFERRRERARSAGQAPFPASSAHPPCHASWSAQRFG